MAEGFAKKYSSEDTKFLSAGSNPARKVNPNAIKVMREKNIDISNQVPKELDNLELNKLDYVVTMGCGLKACPTPKHGKKISWNIEDPSGNPIKKFRKIRDQIEQKVKKLLGITD